MNGRSVVDANGFIYEPLRGPQRKVEFEPRSDGGFERVEAVWTGCGWYMTARVAVRSIEGI